MRVLAACQSWRQTILKVRFSRARGSSRLGAISCVLSVVNLLGMDGLFSRAADLLPSQASASLASPNARVDVVERFSVWPIQAPVSSHESENVQVNVSVFRPAKPNGAAMIICPGGGYGGLVTREEGEGIARWLNRHGILGVVLEYRLPHGRAFVPLFDAQRTIRSIRTYAKQWGCDPHRIGIIGFSAGGHLAATAATHFDSGRADASDWVERVSSRPDFSVLIYPVISMGDLAHSGSKRNLLGPSPSEEWVTEFSNEKQVTTQTPPAFLAHALDDRAVPPIHSRLFYDSLQRCKVPSKYLELPSGDHGLNGYQGPMWDAWQNEVLRWLASLKIIPEQDVALTN